MRHWLFFSVAILLSAGVFLRTWAVAPEREKQARRAAEMRILASDYTAARREVFGILRNADHEVAAIDEYLSAHSERTVRRTGLDLTLRGMGAVLLYSRGREVAGDALADRVSRMVPPVTRADARSMPIVRRVVLARALGEAGRTAEAELLARSVQTWADDRPNDRIAREQNISLLMDLGWVWKVLGRDDLARANWARLLEFHEGQLTMPYNMACFTALVGQTDRAMEYLRMAVAQYRTDSVREPFELDELLDADPDLEALRGLPEFIELREELGLKVRARRAFREMEEAQRDGGPFMGPHAIPPAEPEPVP